MGQLPKFNTENEDHSIEEWMRCIAENTQECQIIQKVIFANKTGWFALNSLFVNVLHLIQDILSDGVSLKDQNIINSNTLSKALERLLGWI
jgi:hypothetical protein